MAYTRHNWVCGETVTADLLNNIEDGIEQALSGGGDDTMTVEIGIDAFDCNLQDSETARQICTFASAHAQVDEGKFVYTTAIKFVKDGEPFYSERGYLQPDSSCWRWTKLDDEDSWFDVCPDGGTYCGSYD